jgi:hypothetical protein
MTLNFLLILTSVVFQKLFCTSEKKTTKLKILFRFSNLGNPSHKRRQHLRNFNPSVLLLKIFKNGHHRSRHSKGSGIEGVEVECVAVLVLGPQVESSALVVGAVAGTGNFTIVVSGGEPGLNVLRRLGEEGGEGRRSGEGRGREEGRG